MRREDFEDGLDRWGGALEAWPQAEQDAASRLLAQSPAARSDHAAMLAVEQSLLRTAYRECWTRDDLAARATAARQERPARLPWGLRGAACVTLLLAGFAYGALQPGQGEDWFAQAFAPGETIDVN